MRHLLLAAWLVAMAGCGPDTKPEDQPAAPVGITAVNSIGMRFVLIPAGTFMMGDDIDRTTHKVTLTQSFHLGQHEVTQEQYEKVMGTNPSAFTTEFIKRIIPKDDPLRVATPPADRNPVENVSWDEAVEFCRKLSELPEEKSAGNVYRLPTEAEWEYACRAGTTTKYSFGDSDAEAGKYAWYKGNAETTHPVGQKKPNPWGLYDMHGNVGEWCQDSYSEFSSAAVTDPSYLSNRSERVTRGGAYPWKSRDVNSTLRIPTLPGDRRGDLGFRVVRSSIK